MLAQVKLSAKWCIRAINIPKCEIRANFKEIGFDGLNKIDPTVSCFPKFFLGQYYITFENIWRSDKSYDTGNIKTHIYYRHCMLMGYSPSMI